MPSLEELLGLIQSEPRKSDAMREAELMFNLAFAEKLWEAGDDRDAIAVRSLLVSIRGHVQTCEDYPTVTRAVGDAIGPLSTANLQVLEKLTDLGIVRSLALGNEPEKMRTDLVAEIITPVEERERKEYVTAITTPDPPSGQVLN